MQYRIVRKYRYHRLSNLTKTYSHKFNRLDSSAGGAGLSAEGPGPDPCWRRHTRPVNIDGQRIWRSVF